MRNGLWQGQSRCLSRARAGDSSWRGQQPKSSLTPRRKMEQIGSIPVLTASKAFLTDKNADVYHVFNVQQLVASRVFLALILYAAVVIFKKSRPII